MQSNIAFYQDRVLFGPKVSPQVNAYMQQAVAAGEDVERAERLLWQANHTDPGQLEVYIALYKFYFYKNRLHEAEQVVHLALLESATQGGFDVQWQQLQADTLDWALPESPQRVYLYSMKALGFVRLRQQRYSEAQAILQKLETLDPQDIVGSSVVMQLCEAMFESVE